MASITTWRLLLLSISLAVVVVEAFVVLPVTSWRSSLSHAGVWQPTISSSASSMPSRLFASFNDQTDDPFAVLGIDPSPNLDKKDIKRAYKKMALRYHPDVAVDKDASPEAKRTASDRFAKINWAYETLMGKGQATTTSSSTSSASSSQSSSKYEPPHRRTTSYSTSGSYSTDWRDYIPNYDDDEAYDAGGDSFSAIFGDLLAGAAAAMAGSGGRGGVFRDFVEFLEQNVDGYAGSTSDTDGELRVLLNTGSVDEIGAEMDETELVLQQLTQKLQSLNDEIIMVDAEAKVADRYMAKLELEERVAELKARKDVVEGYIKKARKRLLALQTKYKQLIVDGGNDTRAGGQSSTRAPNNGPSSTETRRRHEKKEDAWKDDSFGSFGRSSSSRRRTRRSSSSESNYTAPRSTTSSFTTPSTSSSSVPPHRRTSSAGGEEEGKRRLREIRVDEEFDKLKRELGL